MGYPMTFQRFVRRNYLDKGDYQYLQAQPYPHKDIDAENCGFESHEALERAYRTIFKHWNNDRVAWEGKRNILLGDLRRLENDARDEQAIAIYIAQRTGVDADIVAIVLKEFIEW